MMNNPPTTASKTEPLPCSPLSAVFRAGTCLGAEIDGRSISGFKLNRVILGGGGIVAIGDGDADVVFPFGSSVKTDWLHRYRWWCRSCCNSPATLDTLMAPPARPVSVISPVFSHGVAIDIVIQVYANGAEPLDRFRGGQHGSGGWGRTDGDDWRGHSGKKQLLTRSARKRHLSRSSWLRLRNVSRGTLFNKGDRIAGVARFYDIVHVAIGFGGGGVVINLRAGGGHKQWRKWTELATASQDDQGNSKARFKFHRVSGFHYNIMQFLQKPSFETGFHVQ